MFDGSGDVTIVIGDALLHSLLHPWPIAVFVMRFRLLRDVAECAIVIIETVQDRLRDFECGVWGAASSFDRFFSTRSRHRCCRPSATVSRHSPGASFSIVYGPIAYRT